MPDYDIGDAMPKEFILEIIREKRDILLLESDKYMLPDFPITNEKKEEWKLYRQRLRDITVNNTFDGYKLDNNFEVKDFIWPDIPN
tara:strand:+ start:634 stop:891 length:258 start_codon:yes stop_codon:yes gene_type:complete